jgi:hypothetical protein
MSLLSGDGTEMTRVERTSNAIDLYSRGSLFLSLVGKQALHVGFEVVTAVVMHVPNFWDIAPYSPYMS